MSKLYPFLLRTFFVILGSAFSLLASSQSFQVTGCSGTLGSNLYGPMYSTATANSTSRTAVIYPASQLSTLTGKLITNIYLHRFTTTGSMAGTPNFKIYLKEVSATDWGSSALAWDVTGATLVYDGNPAPIVGTVDGWKNFPLSTNFPFSGSQNLAVYFEYKNTTASTALTWTYEYTSPCVNTSNSNTTKYSNVTTGTLPTSLGSSNYRRPYIGFDYTTGPCDPLSIMPGDATVTPSSSMCSGVNFTLDLINNNTGLGQTYVWQKSSAIGGPYTDISSSSNLTSFTTNSTTTAYYRAAVTCGANTLTSTPVLVTIPSPLPGGTYTINNGIPTGGTNFASFTEAVSAIACGISGPVNFWVEPGSGPYTEQISIPQIAGASASSNVRFVGNGATIQFAPVTANKHVIRLDGADYITLDSLNIVSTATDFGVGVLLMNGANYDSVRGCTIDLTAVTSTDADNSGGVVSTNSTTDLQAAGDASNLAVLNNVIKGGYQGIILNGSTGATLGSNNKISGNTIENFYSIGMELADQNGIIVTYNDIHRTNRATVTTFEGIELNSGTKTSLIEGNRIHDTHNAASSQTGAAYGIFSSANDAAVGSENKIINNVIYNFNSGSGIQYGLYNSNSDGVFYYHNTVVLDHNVATDDATRGFYQTGAATGIQFRNNIVYISRANSGTGERHALYFATSTSVIVSNNNVLYNIASGGAANVIGNYNATNYADLPAWKTANSNAYDQQSISEDPLFVGGGDYTPSNPNLNGIGTNLGVTTDIIGTPRSASPDPGAYEFSVAGLDADISWVSPTAPITAGVKTITVNITNTQTTTINSVNLSYTDGTIVETQNFTGLGLTAGNSVQLSFTTQYNLTQTVLMRAYINLVNGGTDNNQLNDTTAYQNFCLPMNGFYTIDKTAPATNTNFNSFNAAVTALNCAGISGKVVISVVSGTGPYNEQVTLVPVTGASAANNIRFLGNGETITYNTSVSANRFVFKLDGADYITLDSLNIVTTNTTYGWGVHFTNGANYDSVRACTIDVSAVTSTTQANSAGIVMSGSATSVTTAGNASYNTIANSIIKGGYQGVILTGATGGTTNTKGNKITGSTIQNFYANGIEIASSDSTIVSYNNIHRANRTDVTTFAGIEMNGETKNSIIDGNRIHDTHTAATTQSGAAYGVYSTANDAAVGSENKVINNLIYNFNSETGTQYALYNSTSDGVFYYHNTIVLDHAGSTSGTTRGLYQTSAATGIQVKNNIFYITRGGTGTKHGVYFGTTTSAIVSNNNVFYINASGSTVGVGSFGTANAATLADWKAANSAAYDQQSVAEDPMFVNPSAGDYMPTSGPIDNIGTNAGVTTDIFGAARGTSPDPGAYEFVPPPDALPPTIIYTPLLNTGTTANRTLIATITDFSGVQLGTNGPRLYYRKSTDASYVFTDNPVKNGSDYTFTLDMSLLTGVTVGTVIEYYVAAQDSLGNAGTSPAGGSGTTPPGTTAPGSPNSFKIVPVITGVFTVGTGGDYLNLTAIANYLNSMEVAIGGNVIFELTSAYDGTTGETLPVNFNQYITTDANWTVTIRPATGVTGRVTSGDPGSGAGVSVINLNGVDKLIFDGRPGGTGTANEWTFRNTRTAATIGSVFRFADDATYNTIRNLSLQSQATSTATGVVFFNTSTGTLGNSNNTVTANHIHASSGTTISNGIYSSGTASALNAGNVISNNHIYNFDDNGINIAATGNGANWTITGNRLYNTTISPSTQTGILIASANSTNTIITGNVIGGNDENASGLWSNSGNVTVSGISCSGGLATISGNTIMNISGTGTGTAARIQGISQTSVLGTFTISNNTIRNLSTTGTSSGIAFGNQSARGIYIGPSGQFVGTTVTGNTIDNISVESTNPLTTSNIVAGIAAYNLQNTTVANNVITNIKNKTTGTTANAYPLAVGLFASYWSGGTAANNMIAIGENENTNTQFVGIMQIGPGGSNTHNYYNNSIHISGSSGGTISSYGFARGWDSSTVQNQVTNFRNNIVSMQRTSGGGNNYAIANRGTSAAGGWTSNYNDLYNLDPTYVGFWNATGYDFAGWKTASSSDANSVSVQPFFVSESDLHLVTDANCQLLDKGTPITGLTTDIDGDTRNATTPDLGADEFTGNFNFTVTSPAAVCEGVTVNLTAGAVTTGSSTGGTFSYWTDAAATSPLSGPATVSSAGTYYIKLVKGTCSDIKPVTVTITPPASNAAGAVSATECGSATIAGTTQFTYTDCDLIAKMTPAGGSPVNGSVNACVTIDASVQTTSTGESYVQRHYDITPAVNPAAATSDITLYFLQSEFTAFNAANGTFPDLPANSSDAAGIANLRITQYNGTGTAPGNYSGTATQINPADASIVWNSTANRWEITFSVTGSGGFYVHTGGFVLPVTSLELKGEQNGTINKLTWQTATEINNKGFELQRSADGVNFSTIDFVATKATNGNSTSLLDYRYDDARPFTGSNYYRLKQVDKDGRIAYSNMVLLTRKAAEITISSLYPNPTRNELNLVINSPKAEKVTIVLTDLSGKTAMQLSTQLVNGENRQVLNVHALASGTYIIKAICVNGCEATVHRFIKQ